MTDVVIRRATATDIPGIVSMLLDDQIGATRESPGDLTPYRAAFEEIDADPNQILVVAERNGELVGTLQLTIIPGLARMGTKGGLVEAVRVAASARGTGLGTTFGGESTAFRSRRGLERTLFRITIALIVVYVIISMAGAVAARPA